MNARTQNIEDGQTGIASKVLNAVPIQTSWTIHQITMELSRGGSRIDSRTVSGCLKTLTESKLIRESPIGYYQRIKQKEKDIDVSPKKPTDPLNTLSTMAHALRQMATELDEIALEISEKQGGVSEELTKLRTLKNALDALR